MEVPEPRTVSRSGSREKPRKKLSRYGGPALRNWQPIASDECRCWYTANRRVNLFPLAPRLLRHSRRSRLRNLHKRKLQTPNHLKQQSIILMRQISLSLLAQHIQHIDHFLSALNIQKRLPSPRIAHPAKHSRSVPRQKINQHLKATRSRGQFSAVSNDLPGVRQSIIHRKRRRLNRSSLPLRIRFSSRLFIRRFSSSGNLSRHLRLPPILVHHFLTQNPLSRKRPPVNYLK